MTLKSIPAAALGSWGPGTLSISLPSSRLRSSSSSSSSRSVRFTRSRPMNSEQRWQSRASGWRDSDGWWSSWPPSPCWWPRWAQTTPTLLLSSSTASSALISASSAARPTEEEGEDWGEDEAPRVASKPWSHCGCFCLLAEKSGSSSSGVPGSSLQKDSGCQMVDLEQVYPCIPAPPPPHDRHETCRTGEWRILDARSMSSRAYPRADECSSCSGVWEGLAMAPAEVGNLRPHTLVVTLASGREAKDTTSASRGITESREERARERSRVRLTRALSSLPRSEAKVAAAASPSPRKSSSSRRRDLPRASLAPSILSLSRSFSLLLSSTSLLSTLARSLSLSLFLLCCRLSLCCSLSSIMDAASLSTFCFSCSLLCLIFLTHPSNSLNTSNTHTPHVDPPCLPAPYIACCCLDPQLGPASPWPPRPDGKTENTTSSRPQLKHPPLLTTR
mmetsp:Transcript_1820/g.5643  ORF Transcript_1820/g.5643 Transcript_1820/m.5643 type:complete len:447 (-) Transcript_1820:210-1550(-)